MALRQYSSASSIKPLLDNKAIALFSNSKDLSPLSIEKKLSVLIGFKFSWITRLTKSSENSSSLIVLRIKVRAYNSLTVCLSKLLKCSKTIFLLSRII